MEDLLREAIAKQLVAIGSDAVQDQFQDRSPAILAVVNRQPLSSSINEPPMINSRTSAGEAAASGVPMPSRCLTLGTSRPDSA